jgi:hypothetical protein
MTDPGEAPPPSNIIVNYIDATNTATVAELTTDQVQPLAAGLLVYVTTTLTVFVPWSRVIMIQNVDGGGMPEWPR